MRRSFLFFLFLLFLLPACHYSEEEKINQLINRREEAFRKRDLSLYLSCISKAYQDKEEDFNRLQKRMEGYFNTFDRIGYSSWDRSVSIERDTARVVQRFYLEVEKGEKKNHYSGQEAFLLKKEGREWRILRGL